MSKWTIEKLKKQIKRGDTCSIQGGDHQKRMVLGFQTFGILMHYESDCDATVWQFYQLNEKNMKFYRNGIEILPEPEKVIKVRFRVIKGVRILEDVSTHEEAMDFIKKQDDGAYEIVKYYEVMEKEK